MRAQSLRRLRVRLALANPIDPIDESLQACQRAAWLSFFTLKIRHHLLQDAHSIAHVSHGAGVVSFTGLNLLQRPLHHIF